MSAEQTEVLDTGPALLTEWALDPESAEFLIDTYGPDGPQFTSDGNGEPVHAAVGELINRTDGTHTLAQPWQPGDLMAVDTIRTTHSREAYIETFLLEARRHG